VRYDLMTYYILKCFHNKYSRSKANGDFHTMLCSKRSVKNALISFMDNNSSETPEAIGSIVDEIFEYLVNTNYIRKNDVLTDCNRPPDPLDDRYYLRPRGDIVFSKLLDTTFLFEVLRDSFYFDELRFSVLCSCRLSQMALFKEYLIYLEDLFVLETEFLRNILGNKALYRIYYDLFGNSFIGEQLSYTLQNSINRYYYWLDNTEDSNVEVRTEIRQLEEGISAIRQKAESLRSYFSIK